MSKTLIYTIILSTFIGCKSVSIKNAIKQKYVSGVPNGTSETIVSITLETNDIIIIDSVYFGEKTNRIESYSIYDLSNGMILKPNEILKKGKYYIQMSSSKNKTFFNDSDEIHLTYLSYGKLKTKKIFITEVNNLLMKSNVKH